MCLCVPVCVPVCVCVCLCVCVCTVCTMYVLYMFVSMCYRCFRQETQSLKTQLAHPPANMIAYAMKAIPILTKNDKRLFELYILFRIKLLLSAEIKYDEIEKKSKWDSGYWIGAFFPLLFFWFNSLILSNENPWVIRIAGVDLLLLTNIYRIWPKFRFEKYTMKEKQIRHVNEPPNNKFFSQFTTKYTSIFLELWIELSDDGSRIFISTA